MTSSAASSATTPEPDGRDPRGDHRLLCIRSRVGLPCGREFDQRRLTQAVGDTSMADLSKTEAQRDTNLERPDPPQHPAQNTGPRRMGRSTPSEPSGPRRSGTAQSRPKGAGSDLSGSLMGRRQLLDDELGDRRQVDQSVSKRVGRPDLALRGPPPWASHNGPHRARRTACSPLRDRRSRSFCRSTSRWAAGRPRGHSDATPGRRNCSLNCSPACTHGYRRKGSASVVFPAREHKPRHW